LRKLKAALQDLNTQIQVVSGSIPDPTENELTDDELDAVQAANAPSASNPFATIEDINVDVESRIWSIPVSPNARDLEFNSTTMAADTVWADASMNAITPDNNVDLTVSSLPASVPRYKVHSQRRRSHLQWQTKGDGNMRYVYWPWSAPTNASVYTDANFLSYNNSNILGGESNVTAIENEAGLRLCLFKDNSGKPDTSNYIYFEIHYEVPPGGAQTLCRMYRCGQVVSGTDTRLPTVTGQPTYGSFTQPNSNHFVGYMGIRKENTSYQFFLGTDFGITSMLDTNRSGNPGPGKTHTYTNSIAWLGFRFTQTSTARIYTIFHADFLRVVDSATFLPW
jgi:hypothetical protein